MGAATLVNDIDGDESTAIHASTSTGSFVLGSAYKRNEMSVQDHRVRIGQADAKSPWTRNYDATARKTLSTATSAEVFSGSLQQPLSDSAALILLHPPRKGNGPSPLRFTYNAETLGPSDKKKLNVGFMGGTEYQRQLVVGIFEEIGRFSGLPISIVVPKVADIRVSFEDDGFWSYVGTDAQARGSDEATMNLALKMHYSHETELLEQQRRVRHEVMHAHGALHEHASPAVPFTFVKTRVLERNRAQLYHAIRLR